jgi:type II protein arginine methyltransferase
MNDFNDQLSSVLDLEKLNPAARSFIAAIAHQPDLPLRLAKMGRMFHKQGKKDDGVAITRAARALAPGDFRVSALTAWLDRQQAPLWHFSIVRDHDRNLAYARALERFVKPGMIVYEIGTGTSILAMLAARAGAKHVYTCELKPDVAEAAREIIRRNGFEDRVTVINKNAKDVTVGVDLPERADLFVAEIVDNALLGEYVLDLTESARANVLKPGAILLPHTVAARGCLIGRHAEIERFRMGRTLDFDLTAFNRFAPAEINAGEGGGDFTRLSEDIDIARFDLAVDAPAEAMHEVQFTASCAGRAEGVLRWLHLDFGGSLIFENRPPQKSSWYPQIHVFADPVDVARGDEIGVSVFHDRERLFLARRRGPGR